MNESEIKSRAHRPREGFARHLSGETGLADRHVRLELTPAARTLVAREGFDPVYGARPLKRFLQRQLESKIGRALIAGDIQDGGALRVDVAGDQLTVAIENPQLVAA